MRALDRGLFLLALVVSLASCGQGDAGAPSTLDRTPAARPARTAIEIAIDGGDPAIAALRERLPEGLARAAAPVGIVGLLDAIVDVPDALEAHVDASSPVRALVLGSGGAREVAIAVRVRPLPSSIARTAGGPRGASMIGDAATALADDVLVHASSREALDAALPYLAFTAMGEGAGDGLVVRVLGETLLAELREAAATRVSRLERTLRAQASAERARHAEPPSLGEPEAVIDTVASWISSSLAYLPDVERVELRVLPTPDGLSSRVVLQVREGSPLSRELEAWPMHEPFGLSALGPTTAIAVASASPREARAASRAAWLARARAVAGTRLDDEGARAIEEAMRAWDEARGERGMWALGVGRDASGAEGAYALSLSDGGSDVDATTLASALRLAWPMELARSALGCPAPAGGAGVLLACPEGAGSISLARTGAVSSLGVDLPVAGHRGLLEGVRRAATEPSTHDADLQRELSAVGPRARAVVVVAPGRVLAALGAISPELRASAASSPEVARAATLVIALRDIEDGQHEVVISTRTRALAELGALIGAFGGD